MKKQILNNLNELVGEEVATKIFNANILSHSLTGYKRGKILTLAELRALPEETIINIRFYDDIERLIHSVYGPLYKGEPVDIQEWSVDGNYPFPIDKIREDELIEKIYNGEEYFTISEAINFN